jgi:hypothetical protein
MIPERKWYWWHVSFLDYARKYIEEVMLIINPRKRNFSQPLHVCQLAPYMGQVGTHHGVGWHIVEPDLLLFLKIFLSSINDSKIFSC